MDKWHRTSQTVTAGALLLLLTVRVSAAALVIHEWGTFTSLQDEAGHAIGGINTDDEPVPPFVHRLSDGLLIKPTQVPTSFFQGAPACHPDVTMRLETPVIYFHPARGETAQGIDVTAQFHGGWLTEFYPGAEVTAPGVNPSKMTFGSLSAKTTGSVTWRNLVLGKEAAGPATAEPVWMAPRAVNAATVQTATGEAEKFLFYRGVAHLDAPLAVARDPDRDWVLVRSQWPASIEGTPPRLAFLWLVDVDAHARLAFRLAPPMTLATKDASPTQISGLFAKQDYAEDNRAKLKTALGAVLVGQGLFGDEAQALLNTWELSYFKSPGKRIFFIVPRAWTDANLPLSVSVAAEITRVMVGRIELVTQEERDALAKLAKMPSKTIAEEGARLRASFLQRQTANPIREDVLHGRRSLEALGVEVPESYAMYLSLGRFRNALLLDEAKRRPSKSLDAFISTYQLKGYAPAGS